MKHLTETQRDLLNRIRRSRGRQITETQRLLTEISALRSALETSMTVETDLLIYKAREAGLPLSRIAREYGTTDARTIKGILKRVEENPDTYGAGSLAAQVADLAQEVGKALNIPTEPEVRLLSLVSVSEDKYRDHTYEFEVRNLTMKDGERIGSKILEFTPVTGTALKNPLDTPEEFEVKEKVARALTNNPEYVTLVKRAISTSPYAATDPLMEGWTDDDATE